MLKIKSYSYEGDYMIQLLINSYIKNLSIEKAILISKQFCIDFTYKEMAIVLPFLKDNYTSFANENSKIYLLNNLATISSTTIASKCEQLVNKLLIIFS